MATELVEKLHESYCQGHDAWNTFVESKWNVKGINPYSRITQTNLYHQWEDGWKNNNKGTGWDSGIASLTELKHK